MKKFVFLTVLIAGFALFSSCNDPSPLVGKWSDNENSISFTSEGTFTLKTATTTRDGTYSAINNVLVLDFSDDQRILSEWDVRGSMLYIYIYDSTDPQFPSQTLVLYKVG